MSETQQSIVHTPGPWEQNGNAVHKRRSPHFATCIAVCDGSDRQANARLIAAAPELLEAIQAALRIESLWMPPDGENNPEYDAEFAALATMRNLFKEVVAKIV
jgi:hypothetical protein